MKKYLLILFICLPLIAAKKQTVSSEQWVAEYKGNGTLTLFEGKKMSRDREFISDVFSHYKYALFNCTNDVWGGYQPCAVFLIENGDEKGKLKIKPKKNVQNLIQTIQIVGSNSSFKLIKVLIKDDDDHNVFKLKSSGILIDGDVDKIILKTKIFVASFYFRNVGLFAATSMYESYLKVGQPNQIISNAYVDINGYTNYLTSFTHGNIDKIKVKYEIDNTVILAGAKNLRSVYTKDISDIYANHPPSGNIGSIKAKIITATGRKETGWRPATSIVSAKRPKLKIKPEKIITEGTSVYITQ